MLAVAVFAVPLVPDVGTAQGGSESSLPVQPIAEGEPLFVKACAQCHPPNRKPAADASGPDLRRSEASHDQMALAGALWNHGPVTAAARDAGTAPATLSPDEMRRLVGYLFSVNFADDPGDAARGRELFERESCARCHQIGGRGGTVGPRLDEMAPHVSPAFMAQALWNHGPTMATKMAELGIARPRLVDADVADIVAFLAAGHTPEAEPVYTQGANIRAGEALFRSKGCAGCHQEGGAGVGPDLASRRSGEHVSNVVGALWNHGPAMWAKMNEHGVAFPSLNTREAADLLAYVSFLQFVGGRGDAANGERLLRDKSCTRCHQIGDAVAPSSTAPAAHDLVASAALQSPAYWLAAMWNHGPVTEREARGTHVQTPRFDDGEMRDVVEFLRSRRADR